ncbi:MAG: cbb3-type cytochrome oxidase assembly protein CcoS [Deltaproteobacteria bacterium]|nr:cbb3-type cytochrome oxidase assembly protein CcoS [Deltaproteobacteria bacterium]
MEMLYIMIPAVIYLGLVGLVFLIWSIKTGQFEDLEGPKYRIFFEDDDAPRRDGEGR